MDDTTADVPSERRGRPARWASRFAILVMVLFVAAGLAGAFGPRTGEKRTTSGSLTLSVEYAAVTRAGEPAPLHVRVEQVGGFTGPVQLALCDDYFDHLDFQSWYPTPSAEAGSGSQLLYEFDPPPGDVFEVSLDARAAPGQFGGIEECEVSVLDDAAAQVSTSFRTWRMP